MKKQIYLLLLFSFMLIGCESSILDDPSTTISFSLPTRSNVTVTVLNSYNTVVAILVDGEVNTGTHSVAFKGDNLPEGIYYYIMEATGVDSNYYFKSTRQMVLIK